MQVFPIVIQIDNVEHPSWQAQITGTKKWTLEPPPECYYECHSSLEVVVDPGDISKCCIYRNQDVDPGTAP